MENFNVIQFHKTRDFSQKVNATIEFIRQNIKSLGKSLLIVAGPPVLAAGLLRWSFATDLAVAGPLSAADGAEVFRQMFLSVSFWIQMLVMAVFFIVTTSVTIATINNYMMLYEEKQTNRIDTQDVWNKVRESFGMYLGTNILFIILLVALYIVAALVIVMLALITPVLAVIAGVVMIPAFIYCLFACTLMFIIRSYERAGFFESMSRSFALMRGKWWSTFGLTMVLYLLAFIVSFVISLPGHIISQVVSLNDVSLSTFGQPNSSAGIVGMISFMIAYLVQSILLSLPNIGIAFQYFNLVERKEARGLMNQLEFIGAQPSQPTGTDEDY